MKYAGDILLRDVRGELGAGVRVVVVGARRPPRARRRSRRRRLLRRPRLHAALLQVHCTLLHIRLLIRLYPRLHTCLNTTQLKSLH